jgi:hypothetical protein
MASGLSCSRFTLLFIIFICTVWIQVKLRDGIAVGVALKIKPVPEDVADLCERVKAKCHPRLAHCAANELLVFPSGALEEAKALDPGDAVPENTTSKNPLIVVAPQGTQISFSLSWPLVVFSCSAPNARQCLKIQDED